MIRVHDVRKSFGPVVALDGVSLEISSGERVAFVGANGSGKTTLLRALLGLIQVTGSISIADNDLVKEPHLALRHVAYIPQISPPLDATADEVVRAQAALRGKKEEATWSRGERLGLAVDRCRNKRFRDLSGGMKQKLLAAMALAAETPVLICDEPTANLDEEARHGFFEQLEERPSGGILVVCSHREDEVSRLVTRAIFMAEGRIVQDGPPANKVVEGSAKQVSP